MSDKEILDLAIKATNIYFDRNVTAKEAIEMAKETIEVK